MVVVNTKRHTLVCLNRRRYLHLHRITIPFTLKIHIKLSISMKLPCLTETTYRSLELRTLVCLVISKVIITVWQIIKLITNILPILKLQCHHYPMRLTKHNSSTRLCSPELVQVHQMVRLIRASNISLLYSLRLAFFNRFSNGSNCHQMLRLDKGIETYLHMPSYSVLVIFTLLALLESDQSVICLLLLCRCATY